MLPAFELLIPDFTLSRVMEEGYSNRQKNTYFRSGSKAIAKAGSAKKLEYKYLSLPAEKQGGSNSQRIAPSPELVPDN
jgi:hypothetical protein